MNIHVTHTPYAYTMYIIYTMYTTYTSYTYTPYIHIHIVYHTSCTSPKAKYNTVTPHNSLNKLDSYSTLS